MHPALLDACFQAVGAHPVLRSDTTGTLMLPLGVRRLRAYASTRNAHYCYARIVSVTPAAVEVDLDLLDEDGAVLLRRGWPARRHRCARQRPARSHLQ